MPNTGGNRAGNNVTVFVRLSRAANDRSETVSGTTDLCPHQKKPYDSRPDCRQRCLVFSRQKIVSFRSLTLTRFTINLFRLSAVSSTLSHCSFDRFTPNSRPLATSRRRFDGSRQTFVLLVPERGKKNIISRLFRTAT